MRTTLILDDRLLRRAKEAAAKAGCTVSDIVNQALGESLAHREERRPRFEMITYGSGRSDHEPADFAAALDAEDAASLRG